MKKLLAVLLACSAVTFAFAGCGDSEESSDKDIDKDLIGSWYSEDLGGNMCFDEDKKISMTVDYTSMMYFDEDFNLVLNDVACPSEYDGSTLSVVLGEDYGYEEDTELLTLERTGKADEDSIDGEYELTSGELYTTLQEMFEDSGEHDLTMTIDGETLTINVSVCEYTADGEKLQFKGDGIELFDFESEEDAICDYEIDGDTLTIDDGSDDILELTKAD